MLGWRAVAAVGLRFNCWEKPERRGDCRWRWAEEASASLKDNFLDTDEFGKAIAFPFFEAEGNDFADVGEEFVDGFPLAVAGFQLGAPG